MISIPKFFQKLFQSIKEYFEKIRQNFHEFSVNSPTTLQNIQLCFIYFFAVVDLLHSVLNNVFSLEYFPEMLTPFLPFIKGIIFSPFFQIWASPEKVFFLSYIVIELMIIRSVFQFSKLIKYNILLIFALLMLQSLAVSYWDIFFHREVVIGVSRWSVDQGALIYTDKDLAINFFFHTFLFFIFLYIYSFIRGLQGKFVTIPTMEWLTDSIAFWLRVKTPTMRVGKRKKQNGLPLEVDNETLESNDGLPSEVRKEQSDQEETEIVRERREDDLFDFDDDDGIDDQLEVGEDGFESPADESGERSEQEGDDSENGLPSEVREV
jgi:hypothetical protein